MKLKIPKKTTTNSISFDINALKRMKEPNYSYINKGLSINATPLEKSKYEVCQDILSYIKEEKFSDQELKKTLGIKQTEFDYLVYCHIEKFTLDKLVSYASKLFAPFHLGIIPEKSLLYANKHSNNRLKKHL